ncbi:MAG TPA: TldD/PmbA family protein [Syntrophorhabdaceae bacterium]|nr:TldD/PmbA family protein [Syntrophorhabdaceae bacterium]
MNKNDLINMVMEKLSGRFDEYELFYLNEREKKIEARDGGVSAVEMKEEEGCALRAVKDARPVFAYTYDRDDPAGKLIANVEVLLPVVEKDESYILPKAYARYQQSDLFDTKCLAVSDDEKKALAIDVEKTIREYDKRIVAVRNCEFQQIELEAAIESSKGVRARAVKTIFLCSALAVAKQDDEEVSWYDWRWSHYLAGVDSKKMGIDIAEKAVSMLFAKQIPTGTYEGILTPRASADLLGILSESFLAENLFKDKTRLKGKEGASCFAQAVTVTDSGMEGLDAFPFDGEGVPSGNNVVIDRGVFRTFLYDVYFANKLGKASTGNSVRGGLKSPPKCGSRGMAIKTGSSDIRRTMTNGIVIEELMGTHTANAITGDFSVGAVGFIYRSGTKEPFQGVMFSGNVFDLFNNIKEAGTDITYYGSFGSPSLYVEGLKISGT